MAINDNLHPAGSTDGTSTPSSATISRADLLKAGAVAAAGLGLGLDVKPAAAAAPRIEVGATNTTITWYVRTNQYEQIWEEAAIKAYAKVAPNVHINRIAVLSNNGIWEAKLHSLIQSGQAPDVWSHWGLEGFTGFYQEGLILNLDPYLAQAGLTQADVNVPSNIWEIYKRNGHVYGIPFASLSSKLFYNKDIFDAYNKAHPNAPVAHPTINWDDKSWNFAALKALSQKLTGLTVNGAKTYGFAFRIYPLVSYSWLAGSEVFNQTGAYQSGRPTSANLTDPKLVAFLTELQNGARDGWIAPYADAIRARNAGTEPIIAGNIAMQMTGDWAFGELAQAKMRFGAAAYPWFTTNRPVVFTDPWIVYSKSKQPVEALKFIKFLVTDPVVAPAYIQLSGFTPANPAYSAAWYNKYSKATGQSVADLTKLQVLSHKYGTESPNHTIGDYSEIDNTMQKYYDAIFSDQGSAASLLPQCKQAVDGVLQRAFGQ